MDRLTRTVREQVALGRLLPLGGPDDTAWITESAAVRVLRRAAAALPGVRLGEVTVLLTDGPEGPDGPDAPQGARSAAPVGALPHLPLRIEAGFEAAAYEPLPVAADRLRDVLWEAARELFGRAVEAVDLRVTGLLGEDVWGVPDDVRDADDPGFDSQDDPEDDLEVDLVIVTTGPAEAVAVATLIVPGVLRLTRRLAGRGSGVRVHDAEGPVEAPGRQVQVQIAVAAGHRVPAVARAVAAAVSAVAAPGAPGPVTTAVVVTDVV